MLTSSESVKSGADRDEKPNFVSLFGNRSLSLYHNSKQNGHQQAKSGVDRRSTSIFGCAAIQSSTEDIHNIFKVEEGVMKVDIFKKLENTEIWEFRTLYNGICYRLFSFWDTEEETLVIATHGIVKKTQKTPLKEIAKAEEIRKEYFNNKKK